MQGVDVVLSGRGADPVMAQAVAAAVRRNGVAKLCWPGGTTNVLAEDGITPNYLKLQHLGSWVEGGLPRPRCLHCSHSGGGHSLRHLLPGPHGWSGTTQHRCSPNRTRES